MLRTKKPCMASRHPTAPLTKKTHHKSIQHRSAGPLSAQKRTVSIFDIPAATTLNPGESVQFMQNENSSRIQEEIDDNFSTGSLDLTRGKVIFDARSSNHNFVRYRVLSHTATPYTHKEEALFNKSMTEYAQTTKTTQFQSKQYYSFQQLYDNGQDEHDDPFVNVKSVVVAGSDNTANLHLPSSSALIGSLVFSTHQPQKTLYIGGWGGVIPHYIAKRIGSDVEMIDPDSMSMYMSKCYAPNIFYDGVNEHGSILNAKEKISFAPDVPEHPFDIIFTHKLKQLQQHTQQDLSPSDKPAGEQLEMDDAHMEVSLQQSLAYFQHARSRGHNTGNISYQPSIIDTNSHLSSLFSQHYLDTSQGMPLAIKFIQKSRHLDFIKKQHNTTLTNLHEIIIEKFNIRELIQSDVNHEVFTARTKLDEVNALLETTKKEFSAANSIPHRSRLQTQIDQYEEVARGLNEVLTFSTISKPQETTMVNKIIKWIGKRMTALDDHNSRAEIWGEGEKEDSDQSSKDKADLTDIFDDDELCFADKFNKRFFEIFLQDEEDIEDIFGNEEGVDNASIKAPFENDDGQPKNAFELYERLNTTQSMDCVWFQTSLHTLSSYKTALEKNQKDVVELEQDLRTNYNISEQTLAALSTIHENILDSISLPMQGYDAIVHDHENDPISEETLHLIRQTLFMHTDDDSARHGVYIKRMAVAAAEILDEFGPSLKTWVGDVNAEASKLKKVFAHVYWSQPALDTVIFAATDSPLASDSVSTHPLEPDQIIDNTVQLWESGAIGLDVVEQSDKWNYILKPNENIRKKLIFDPNAFYNDDADQFI